MIRLIFVDVEGKGPAAGLNDDERFEWGAVDFSSWLQGQTRTFHGVGATPENFRRFEAWILGAGQLGDRFVMVTDNVAYDWQFINHYMHRFLGRNILGHSARRIGDFALGMEAQKALEGWRTENPGKSAPADLMLREFCGPQKWKRLRITKHDHHPVNDALGNVQAFARLLGWNPPQGKLL